MSGDTSNASIWAGADVYVGPLTATDPATIDTEFSADWDLVGLLDGTDGFTHSRDEDKNDFYAWGGVLVATSRKNFKATVKFSALEDNDTVRSMVWPGSTASKLVVPRPAKIKLALETRRGAKKKRLICANYVEVDVDGDIKDGEDDLTKYELLATVFPDTGEDPAVLWNRQFSADDESSSSSSSSSGV